MAVPARNVGRAIATEGFIPNSDILEGLVQRGADVHITVGEGRSIMEDEGFFSRGAVGLKPSVKPDLFPVGDATRLPLGKAGAH